MVEFARVAAKATCQTQATFETLRPAAIILAANRSEIAIRVFRSAHELDIRTVAIYSHEDRYALHRFKADEAYPIGRPGEPLKSYLDIEAIVKLALGDRVYRSAARVAHQAGR
jgi:pyruvate carboxylase